eukprot:scaffold4855_cov31-Phaeocystis_antarctica.AAC.1
MVGARQHNACLAMRGGSRVRVRQRKGRAPARMNAGPPANRVGKPRDLTCFLPPTRAGGKVT